MNEKNRTEERIPLQKECILINESGLIKAQIINISRKGLRVNTDSKLPFKNGCELGVLIERMELPMAKLMWTEKDFNNTTTLELKFRLPFPDFKHKYFAPNYLSP